MQSEPEPRLPTRVLLDACVLFPVWSCDVLLTAQEVGLIDAVIASPDIIEEARRSALRRYPDKVELVARRFDAVIRFVEGADHPLPSVDVDDLVLINEKDRHVLQAAIHHGADYVVTSDVDLGIELNTWATRAQRDGPFRGSLTIDGFIAIAALEVPDKLAFLIRRMARKRQRPPMTDTALLELLRTRLPSLRSFEMPSRR